MFAKAAWVLFGYKHVLNKEIWGPYLHTLSGWKRWLYIKIWLYISVLSSKRVNLLKEKKK